MEWKGERIKELAKEKSVSLSKLSELTGVTRQAVNGWIRGRVPKGGHLLSLCKIFNVSSSYFFSDEEERSITLPVHRTVGKTKVTPELRQEAMKLAKEYAFLFRNDLISGILPVIRVSQRDPGTAGRIAYELRSMSDIPRDYPMDCKHAFTLMERLGTKLVFRYFPRKIKAYAFFTKIYGHRVIFVNNHTNVLDLIFPLIHEAVHAVRDENQIADVFDAEEEEFCDDVANRVQFPDGYVDLVYGAVSGLSEDVQADKLKGFGRKIRAFPVRSGQAYPIRP